VNFGVKALAALMAYRDYVLGRRGAYGIAAWHWLEVGGSARLLYYAPKTAYDRAKRAKVERLASVEEMITEALRRLFLKPGADRYRDFVELLRSGKLALMPEKAKSSYVFKLFRLEEDSRLVDLGIELWIEKVGKGIIYALKFDDVERWLEVFKPELETAVKAAEEVEGRLPVEDLLPYMMGWVNSDVAISRKGNKRVLEMRTSYLWQLAETHALFDWSYITVPGVSLTLEGPKPQFHARASLEKLDEAIRRSARDGWLKMLGVEAESWEGLKRWVAGHWSEVIDAVERRLESVRAGPGFHLARALEELKSLKSKLDDDKTAREVVAPALLLMQAERLGVDETTLKYFAAVASGAIDGDGYISAARKEVGLTSGERAIALLWAAALAAHGIKANVWKTGGALHVITSGDNVVKLARLFFLYGPPLLEGDERFISHKLAEAVELGAGGLDIRWEGLRRTPSGFVAADLIISEGGASVKYNVYLRKDAIILEFESTDRSRVELAARLLRLTGVNAEVQKEGGRDVWYVKATTDRLAAGREELRKALVEIVRKAVENGWMDASKAEGWLEKLERGLIMREGWPRYHVGLVEGALMVRYRSISPDSIQQEAQRLEKMGLKRGVHFSVKTPEGGKEGYVSVLKGGLARAARLSVHSKDKDQRKLAADFVKIILQRAKEACGGMEPCAVYEKAKEIVEEGKAWGSLTLKGFEKKVEVNGEKYKVKVIDGEAVEEDRGGRKLLRIRITAEVDGVRSDYTITYGRRGRNVAVGRAYARAGPDGREADAERYSALIKALTGREPKVYQRSDGKIDVICSKEHLDGFKRYAELADAIEKWLEETSR
jgi:hypothetical protein